MNATVKALVTLSLLIIGGLCVMAGTPVFNWLPRAPANVIALAYLLVAIVLLLFVPGKAVGRWRATRQ